MKSIWVPVSGQIAQQQKVDTIANNIANINTDGFKKDDLVFKEYLTELDNPQMDNRIPPHEFAPEDFYNSMGAQNSKVKVSGSYTDHTPGQLRPTQNPLDLAIHNQKGNGFFEVLTPQGIAYTKSGSFTLNGKGQMVTNQGYFLLSEGTSEPQNRIINISPNRSLSISGDGTIHQGEDTVGKVNIVHFKDMSALRKNQNTTFLNAYQDNIDENINDSVVKQGHLEASNVNPIQEMAELIKAHRHFDNIQKAIQAYDNINGRAVNDLSRF